MLVHMALKIGKTQTLELRLGEILKERRMSQTDFADKMGLSRQQISQWVSKPTRIDFDTLAKLAQGLGLPAEDLLKVVQRG